MILMQLLFAYFVLFEKLIKSNNLFYSSETITDTYNFHRRRTLMFNCTQNCI